MEEQARGSEGQSLAAHLDGQDQGTWHARWRVEKYAGEADGEPYEVIEGEGNILVNAGINKMLDLLCGAGGTAFNNANAFIGVGDGNGSIPTPAATDTDLTAPTNKLRKAMQATFPTAAASQSVQFQSSFGTSDANFAWREWGIFNASSSGTMLNHKGVSLGVKASGTWVITVTITIA